MRFSRVWRLALPHIGANVAGVVGALLVVAVGRWPQARQARQSEASDQAAAPSA
jgi:hypothetical protein